MTDGPYELPSGWRLVRLGEVCQINPRRPRIDRAEKAATSFIPMNAVNEREGAIAELQARPFSQVKRGYTYFEEGDVLFAKITPCMENGKAAIASGLIDELGFGSTEFHVLQPGQELISKWVLFFVRQERFRQEAKKAFRGAVGQQRVSQEFLEAYPVPIPPLATQRCIVARVEALMERVLEAKRLRAEAEEHTDTILYAAIADVFSDILPDRMPLLDVLSEKPRNGWSPRCDNAPDGMPVLKLGAVLSFRFNPSAIKRTSLPVNLTAHYWLTEGDLLISRSNTPELVGHAAVYSGEPHPCIYPDLLMRMRVEPSKADPQFIIYWLQGTEARRYIRAHAMGASSTMKRITQGNVCALPFPNIGFGDQRRIVTYLDSVQAQAAALKRAQKDTDAELRRLEQVILDRAFRGEL